MEKQFLVMLTTGKEDSGTRATLAFSCALASISMGLETSVFLTGDGSVWGLKESSVGIAVNGYPPLNKLIQEFLQADGKILLCSVCYRECETLATPYSKDTIAGVELGGFTKAVAIANDGSSMTF